MPGNKKVDPRLLAVVIDNIKKKTQNPVSLAPSALSSAVVAPASSVMPTTLTPPLPPLKPQPAPNQGSMVLGQPTTPVLPPAGPDMPRTPQMPVLDQPTGGGYGQYAGVYGPNGPIYGGGNIPGLPPRDTRATGSGDFVSGGGGPMIFKAITSDAEDIVNTLGDSELGMGAKVKLGQKEAALAAKDKLKQIYREKGLTPEEAEAKASEDVSWKTNLTPQEIKLIEKNIQAEDYLAQGGTVDMKDGRVVPKSYADYIENKQRLKNIGDNRGMIMAQRAKAERAGNKALADSLTQNIADMEAQRIELGKKISEYQKAQDIAQTTTKQLLELMPSVANPGSRIEMKPTPQKIKKTPEQMQKDLEEGKKNAEILSKQNAKKIAESKKASVEKELAADTKRREAAKAKATPAPSPQAKATPAPASISNADIARQKNVVLSAISKKNPTPADKKKAAEEMDKYKRMSYDQLKAMADENIAAGKDTKEAQARLMLLHKGRVDELQKRLDNWK